MRKYKPMKERALLECIESISLAWYARTNDEYYLNLYRQTREKLGRKQ